jgi:hypothetical protein
MGTCSYEVMGTRLGGELIKGKKEIGIQSLFGFNKIRRKLCRVKMRWDSGVLLGNLNRVGLR